MWPCSLLIEMAPHFFFLIMPSRRRNVQIPSNVWFNIIVLQHLNYFLTHLLLKFSACLCSSETQPFQDTAFAQKHHCFVYLLLPLKRKSIIDMKCKHEFALKCEKKLMREKKTHHAIHKLSIDHKNCNNTKSPVGIKQWLTLINLKNDSDHNAGMITNWMPMAHKNGGGGLLAICCFM